VSNIIKRTNDLGIRCTNIICINQASHSFDNQSCVCQLGSQGRDCSIRCGESTVKNSWLYIVYIQIGEQSWCSGSLIDPWTF